MTHAPVSHTDTGACYYGDTTERETPAMTTALAPAVKGVAHRAAAQLAAALPELTWWAPGPTGATAWALNPQGAPVLVSMRGGEPVLAAEAASAADRKAAARAEQVAAAMAAGATPYYTPEGAYVRGVQYMQGGAKVQVPFDARGEVVMFQVAGPAVQLLAA